MIQEEWQPFVSPLVSVKLSLFSCFSMLRPVMSALSRPKGRFQSRLNSVSFPFTCFKTLVFF